MEFPPALRAKLARPNWSLADRFAREEIFSAYRPKIAIALAQDHVAIAGDVCRSYVVRGDSVHGRVCDTWRDADAHTRSQHGELRRAHLSRAFDEQSIRDHADNYARIAGKIVTHEQLRDFVESCGATFPEGRTITPAGAAARCADPQWWRRQLRRTWTRRAENVMREIGIVRKGREPYASDDAVMARAVMKAKGRKFLENHVAANERGEQLSLLALAEHSLANPALRRGEFMTRVRGFEEIAADAKHTAQFWTLTAPSAFHAQLSTGQKNPNFARAIVRDAQAWLCKQWARVRAKLKRLSILMYGFRIAEPHHDGTPHWHMLIFCRRNDAGTIEAVIRGYWLAEYADEKGAHEHRAKCIEIDSSQGSAAGYVAKYVSKNIDGAGAIGEAQDDETGRAVADGVRRVDAWASLHGIRQFQQIGGPPVGLWRELRRLTEVSSDREIERARAAADAGDWRAFIYGVACGGINAGRRTHVKVAREPDGQLTKYAEEKAPPVIGVRCTSVVEITRPHTWRIQRCGTSISSSDGARAMRASRSSDTGAATVVPDTQHGSETYGSPFTSRSGLTGLSLNPEFWSKRKSRGARRATHVNRVGPDHAGAAGSGSFSSVFSDLGPVAITVRGRVCGSCGASPVIKGKHKCEPSTLARVGVGVGGRRTAASPARLVGPRSSFFEWESTLRKFEREHGRYPSAAETINLWKGT